MLESLDALFSNDDAKNNGVYELCSSPAPEMYGQSIIKDFHDRNPFAWFGRAASTRTTQTALFLIKVRLTLGAI